MDHIEQYKYNMDSNWNNLISYRRKKLTFYNSNRSYIDLDFNQVEKIVDGYVYRIIGSEAEAYLERICDGYCLMQLHIVVPMTFPHRSRQELMWLDLHGWNNTMYQWYPYMNHKSSLYPDLMDMAQQSYYMSSDYYRIK